MKDMLHMGLFLFVIAAVAGVLLAYTESVTAPLILENQRKAEELARREVLPNAEKFNESKFADTTASQTYSYSTGVTSNGEVAGVVIKVAPKGYAGPIEMVVGIDKTGKINGYKILAQKETPGLGTKLSEPVFAEPFKKLITDKPNPVFLVKKDGGDVDGITAATISSRAFCKGVSEALELFKKVQPQLTAVPQTPAIPEIPAATASQTSVTGGNQ